MPLIQYKGGLRNTKVTEPESRRRLAVAQGEVIPALFRALCDENIPVREISIIGSVILGLADPDDPESDTDIGIVPENKDDIPRIHRFVNHLSWDDQLDMGRLPRLIKDHNIDLWVTSGIEQRTRS